MTPRVLMAALCALLLVGCSEPDEPYEAANDTGPRLAATCLFSHATMADPMFRPTTKPPAHLHHMYGNTSTNQDSTYQTLLNASTNCKQPADHAAYWIAPLHAGEPRKEMRAPKMVTYYEVTPGISAEQIRPFPPDFRDVSRKPMFRCGSGDFKATPPERCGAATFEIRMEFEQCYDPSRPTAMEANTRLPRDGKCPDSHPTLLPKIQTDLNYRLSEPISNLSVPGTTSDTQPLTTFHMNFINAWKQDELKRLVGLCLRQTGQNEARPDECRTSDN